MPVFDIENYLTNNLINEGNFETIALELFRFQYQNCEIYRDFVNAIQKDENEVTSIEKIPFLPITFFKTHQVISFHGNTFQPDLEFRSSGTTGMETSKHLVLKKDLYTKNLLHNFEQFYGSPTQYIFYGLLPSYLERNNSSLVYMCKKLMKYSGQEMDYFFLHDFEGLQRELKKNSTGKIPFIIGVTFALLDFAEKFPMDLSHAILMETGGMKGRKKEMTRYEVHSTLKNAFQTSTIHSEYGMTELLSQAYSKKDGIYFSPASQRIFLRDEYDPLSIKTFGKGLVNVIDLANLYSCSFIATDDIGKLNDDGSFEIVGRVDFSALRGCSLLSI